MTESKTTRTDTQALAEWVRQWREAGNALEAIHRRELQQYDYAAHADAIDEMLQWAVDHPVERPLTGLIEQQYWFTKWRERLLATAQEREMPL